MTVPVGHYKENDMAKSQPRKTIRPRGWVPRPCTGCITNRPLATNYSKVYSTRGRVRYVKCQFCGNTWTQTVSADQLAMPVVPGDDYRVDVKPPAPEAGEHGTDTGTT